MSLDNADAQRVDAANSESDAFQYLIGLCTITPSGNIVDGNGNTIGRMWIDDEKPREFKYP